MKGSLLVHLGAMAVCLSASIHMCVHARAYMYICMWIPTSAERPEEDDVVLLYHLYLVVLRQCLSEPGGRLVVSKPD